MKTERNEPDADNWAIADEKGFIDVPERLEGLFNRIGFQFRFVTISGKNELQAVCDTVRIADRYAQDLLTAQSQAHDQEMIVANELIATYQALVELYDKELTRIAPMLHIRSQTASAKDIEMGIQLRHNIEGLLAQFRNQNKEGL